MVLEERAMRVRRKSEALVRAALALVHFFALGGVAAAEPEVVRIDYAAPAACPDATAFLRSLKERTTRFRQATGAEKARSFRVRVTGLSSSFSGRLEIAGPDDAIAVRTVDSRSCTEVSSALALMAALAIDPSALVPSALVPSSLGGPSKRADEPATETATTPVAEAERKQRSSLSTVTASARSVPDGPAGPPWRWSAGVQGHTTFAVTPNLGWGADLFVDAEAPDSSTLGPAARAGLFFNQSVVELPTGPSARFRWMAATLEGCPARLKAQALRLAVHPCVALRMGVLHGEGRSMTQPKQVTSLWSDVGPLLRLRLQAADRVNIEAQAALMLPLYRPTFTILDNGSDTSAFSVPALGGTVGIGMSYGFP
jgi:hypothetical protein